MIESELLKLILYIIFKLIVTRIGDLIVDFNLPMGVILYEQSRFHCSTLYNGSQYKLWPVFITSILKTGTRIMKK